MPVTLDKEEEPFEQQRQMREQHASSFPDFSLGDPFISTDFGGIDFGAAGEAIAAAAESVGAVIGSVAEAAGDGIGDFLGGF